MGTIFAIRSWAMGNFKSDNHTRNKPSEMDRIQLKNFCVTTFVSVHLLLLRIKCIQRQVYLCMHVPTAYTDVISKWFLN